MILLFVLQNSLKWTHVANEFEGKMWEAPIFSDPALPDHMWQVKNTYVLCSGKTHHMVKFYQFHICFSFIACLTKDRII